MDAGLALPAKFMWATFDVLFESAIYVLFGFLVAGLLHVYLPTERVVPFLRGRGFRSVAAAAAFGAPLPLCSCGVVPSAVELRRNGASREAVMAFLISTPETSADSIALSWGLLGPVIAIVRPVTAVVTAMFAGMLHFLWGRPGGARGGTVHAHHHAHDHAHPESPGAAGGGRLQDGGPADDGCASCGPADDLGDDCGVDHARADAGGRFAHGIRYAFVSLFDDLAFWFVLGVILTGIITALVPDGFLEHAIHSELLSMIVAAALGIPLYMCASSSTPVAAALLAKGLNPGAALVFLLTGPATNAATVSVVGRVFGWRFVAIYLGAIASVAIGAGLILNHVYDWSAGHASRFAGGEVVHGRGAWVQGAGALVLVVLIALSFRRTGLRPGLRELRTNARSMMSLVRGRM